jgi:hypothetical protein
MNASAEAKISLSRGTIVLFALASVYVFGSVLFAGVVFSQSFRSSSADQSLAWGHPEADMWSWGNVPILSVGIDDGADSGAQTASSRRRILSFGGDRVYFVMLTSSS